MHLLSHYSLLLGWDQGNKQISRFRVIYHFPAYEIMLATSLITHLAINAYMVIRRRQLGGSDDQGKKEGGLMPAGSTERKFHRYAGYVLAASIFGHVYSTRIAGLLFLKNPELYDYTMILISNQHLKNTLAAFLVFFGMSAIWHFLYGTRLAFAILLDRSIAGKPVPWWLKILAVAMTMLLINAIMAVTGHLYPIKPPSHMEVAAEHVHKKMTMGLI
jgi:hypothetical protein